MIFPIGHDRMTVRRLPWVSFGIMAVCLAAAVLAGRAPVTFDDQEAARARVFEYYLRHPDLKLPPALKEEVDHSLTRMDKTVLREMAQTARDLGGTANLAAAQAELDELVRQEREVRDRVPQYRFGLKSTDLSLTTTLTHMFMHAGILHLLGNMFILYLCGPFVEDVWGRLLFGAFYLLAGSFSGLAFTLTRPAGDIPLVGASGAIAGVMGAFLIRHWRARIRFVYWIAVVARGTFEARAWVMLPLWFLGEIFNGWAYGSVKIVGNQVAYWAHAWGFAFGALFALGVALLKIEERFVAPVLERGSEGADGADPALREAVALQDAGQTDRVLEILRRATREKPGDPGRAAAYWSAAVAAGRGPEAAPALVRLMAAEAANAGADAVLDNWRELRTHAPDQTLTAVPALKLATAFAAGHPEEARQVIARAVGEVGPSTPVGVAVQLVKMARRLESPLTADLARKVLAHPDLPRSFRDELSELTGPEGSGRL